MVSFLFEHGQSNENRQTAAGRIPSLNRAVHRPDDLFTDSQSQAAAVSDIAPRLICTVELVEKPGELILRHAFSVILPAKL